MRKQNGEVAIGIIAIGFCLTAVWAHLSVKKTINEPMPDAPLVSGPSSTLWAVHWKENKNKNVKEFTTKKEAEIFAASCKPSCTNMILEEVNQ